MKIVRSLKNLISGRRKITDERVSFEQFQNLIKLAGDALHYKVRAGSSYQWLQEVSNSNPHQFIQDFLVPENNDFYEAEFFGYHQKYEDRTKETHYIDCHRWLRRGNVGPRGKKEHQGTVYFTIPRSLEEKASQ